MFGSDAGAARTLAIWGIFAGCLPGFCGGTALLPREVSDWKPGPAAPAVEAAAGGQVFVCPFPAGTDRHYWDYDIRLDLIAADGVELVYTCENPGAFRSITWYARSGNGWLAAALPVREGRSRHWIPLGDCEKLDTPAGWNQVEAIRLSPWSAARGAGRLILHAADARQAEIAIARPGELIFSNPSEREFGGRAANWMARQLSALALPVAMLGDQDLASSHALARYKVLILPCHPHLPRAVLKNIRLFTEGGGRLLVCYNGDTALGRMLGVDVGAYAAAARPGQWHSMYFPPRKDWQGPAQVFQGALVNLITASAAGSDTRTLAWWCDAQGRRQAEAACLGSKQCVWMPHALKEDDAAVQRRMLAALLDHLLPGIFAGAARQAVAEAIAREEPDQDQDPAAALPRDLHAKAQNALAAGAFAEAWRLADKLTIELDCRAAARLPELSRGLRGIWVGAEMLNADWDKLAAELAAAGLTDVFINVPRTEAPDAQILAACQRQTLRAHIWHICWNLDGMAETDLRRLRDAGRLQQSVDGTAAAWLCPSQAVNQEMELERLAQLADAAGAAGVHLDYVRYPDDRHCYCRACQKAFTAAAGGAPDEPWPQAAHTGSLAEQYRAWRARQISDFVSAVSRRIRQQHPGRQLSAAVYPRYPECIATEGQDWGQWLRNEWLDFVCPMNYTANPGEFAAWTAAQTALPGAAGRVAPGIGAVSSASRLPTLQVLLQAQAAVRAGAHGYVIFALNHELRRDLLPVLKAVKVKSAKSTNPAAPNHAED